MRADRSSCVALETLASLQGLRVAESEMALAAGTARRSAADRRLDEAEARCTQASDRQSAMLGSGHFHADDFRLATAILNALGWEADAARDEAGQAKVAEEALRLEWQGQRHRERQLGSLHTSARRKLHRKQEERAMAEAAQLLLHKTGKAAA